VNKSVEDGVEDTESKQRGVALNRQKGNGLGRIPKNRTVDETADGMMEAGGTATKGAVLSAPCTKPSLFGLSLKKGLDRPCPPN
jgi:hypothetical protein